MKSKIFRYLGFGFVGVFALVGFGLTAGYFAVKFHLTNDPGVVDRNDRYFQEIQDRYDQAAKSATSTIDYSE